MAQQHKQWVLRTTDTVANLEYVTANTPQDLRENQVLVQMRAASLNYRDLAIIQGTYPSTRAVADTVPASDGSGVVKAVGPAVSSFKPGDKVVMHMVPDVPEDALPHFTDISGGLGQVSDGTLRELAAFPQEGLVRMPDNMTFEQAATLPCSGLTAWNALMGLRGRELKAGDYVLVQGTGGVSVAALQFAVAAGATVVATTGKEANVKRLEALGASHVINYKTHPPWGEVARSFTPESRGFDHIVDVGGNSTLGESLKAVRLDGLISLVGLLGTEAVQVDMLSALWSLAVVRGVLLGSKAMFRDMVRFCEEKNVQPALDDVAFSLERADEAYGRLEKQLHFSKVVITIP
ncbi:hypothetical protein GE09DRAFT_226911 [Coniochaeta sp. 2T2.1]|nr:hypothetical protein GE09DRAFT_226911 [Coniochaeta sp. 2T2.1]